MRFYPFPYQPPNVKFSGPPGPYHRMFSARSARAGPLYRVLGRHGTVAARFAIVGAWKSRQIVQSFGSEIRLVRPSDCADYGIYLNPAKKGRVSERFKNRPV